MQNTQYLELQASFRKGVRNGNWRRLSRLEKALVMTATAYAKRYGQIVNAQLLQKLAALVSILKSTRGTRILQRGYEKARALLSTGDRGVFAWAPSLRAWLQEQDYVFWLGTGGLRI
ncbi:MAG TPA: hypothetical protein ENN68_06845 [Methanomicrobia archaeon]|nr:hypothetical protein [Methanomicrobia archaeon]